MGKSTQEQLQCSISNPAKPLNFILQKGDYVFNALFFVVGMSIGFVICIHLQTNPFTLLKFQFALPPQSLNPNSSIVQTSNNNVSFLQFEQGRNLSVHNITDQELFLKVSSLPFVPKEMIFRPKVAFMFMTGGSLPLAPLWEKFFHGHQGYYSIYVHTNPAYQESLPQTSVFYGRRITSQPVYWGTSSMVDAERRLLANALLETSNQRFILVSDSCIPLFNFTTIYNYFINSPLSFIGSFDDPRKSGRGRYNPQMSPQINITHWRKGSQWFESTRELARNIVTDTKYYPVFTEFCHPPCYMDEHYIPTLVNMLYGEMNANRTVTWVDWSRPGPHPRRFIWPDVTDEFLNQIRFREECVYHTENTDKTVAENVTQMCFLFARKFTAQTLEPLLRIAPLVLGFGP